MIDRSMINTAVNYGKGIVLPELVTSRASSIGYFALGVILTLVPYQITNRYHLYEPQLLPFDMVDRVMPFWPWTVWIYFTEYLIFVASWLLIKNHSNRTKYFYSYVFILAISVVTFIFYPVTFPRADYPLSDFAPGLTVTIFEYFRTHMDSPANCLPSLHVSTCYIAAFALLPESRKLFWTFFTWATAVAISTMTTKQHYFIDVWIAFILVVIAYYIFYHCSSYYNRESK